jgi:hypothetical protein
MPMTYREASLGLVGAPEPAGVERGMLVRSGDGESVMKNRGGSGGILTDGQEAGWRGQYARRGHLLYAHAQREGEGLARVWRIALGGAWQRERARAGVEHSGVGCGRGLRAGNTKRKISFVRRCPCHARKRAGQGGVRRCASTPHLCVLKRGD